MEKKGWIWEDGLRREFGESAGQVVIKGIAVVHRGKEGTQ
jgi:hypothetical protein